MNSQGEVMMMKEFLDKLNEFINSNEDKDLLVSIIEGIDYSILEGEAVPRIVNLEGNSIIDCIEKIKSFITNQEKMLIIETYEKMITSEGGY